MQVQPYLNFQGNCQEAIDFYVKAVGAEVLFIMRFADHKDAPCQEGWEQMIMHSTLKIGESILMASDTPPPMQSPFGGFSLSIQSQDEEEAERVFSALSEGANITFPLQTTFWAKKFGMLIDQFGVHWMVNLAY